MNLGHIEALATDPARSQRFYAEAVGFGVTAVQSGRFIRLQKDGLEILLCPARPRPIAPHYADATVAFVLFADNYPGSLRQLADQVIEMRSTVDFDQCYTFTNPDGNWFQLVDPQDD